MKDREPDASVAHEPPALDGGELDPDELDLVLSAWSGGAARPSPGFSSRVRAACLADADAPAQALPARAPAGPRRSRIERRHTPARWLLGAAAALAVAFAALPLVLARGVPESAPRIASASPLAAPSGGVTADQDLGLRD